MTVGQEGLTGQLLIRGDCAAAALIKPLPRWGWRLGLGLPCCEGMLKGLVVVSGSKRRRRERVSVPAGAGTRDGDGAVAGG